VSDAPAAPGRSNVTLEELTAVLLDDTVSPGHLTAAADATYDTFCRLVAVEKESEDTALPSGKALSPRLAATCLKDPMRTAVFLRGIEQAMREKKPVQVVYAGTRPFAPLVLPLMTRFPEARFTFRDIHQSSIDSVRRLVEHFGFGKCDFVVADATTYRHPRPIDLAIVEAMQAALSKEPQVAIVRNLAPQLARGGIVIPQRVTVDGAMGQPVPPQSRVRLGTAVDTENDTYELMARVPVDGYTLAYFTRIEVFGKHVLDEYQSGLTYPQIQWNVRPKVGETLVFKYEMGPHPGLRLSESGRSPE